jgi:putative MATE family efflux protein
MIATILNVFLDLFFVVVLEYGVEGTAIATIISQAVALFSAIFYLKWKDNIIQFKLSDLKFDKKLYVQSVKIGLPSGIQSTTVALGMTAVLGIVNGFGTDVVAAYSVAGRLDAIAILPAMNFSIALSTFVGQNIGAGKMERVQKGFKSTVIMSSIVAISISIIFYFFGHLLMGMFTNDPNVIAIGTEYLIIVSSFYILFSIMFNSNAVMRGAGDTMIPMFITIIALWLIRVPASYFLSNIFGEVGIWWALPFTWAVGLTLSYSYYRTNRWKRKVVI